MSSSTSEGLGGYSMYTYKIGGQDYDIYNPTAADRLVVKSGGTTYVLVRKDAPTTAGSAATNNEVSISSDYVNTYTGSDDSASYKIVVSAHKVEVYFDDVLQTTEIVSYSSSLILKVNGKEYTLRFDGSSRPDTPPIAVLVNNATKRQARCIISST